MISKTISFRRLRPAFDDALAPDSHVLGTRKHLHDAVAAASVRDSTAVY